MTEAQLSPWLEAGVFIFVAFCLWGRWDRRSEKSTFALLAAVAFGSQVSIWMMGDHAPILNWAALDAMAGTMLYAFRSRRLSSSHMGLQRQHATVIGVFAVMALAHLIFYGSQQLGLAADHLMYGRTLIFLTYAQLAVVWLAERAHDAARSRRLPVLGSAGTWLLASVDARTSRTAGGHG